MDSTQIFLLTVVLIIAAAALIGAVQKKRTDARLYETLRKSFGRIPGRAQQKKYSDRLPAYLEHHREAGQIDSITSNDLELNALQERIDCTQSAAGEEYLYWLLRSPLHDGASFTREQICYLQEPAHEPQRIRIQMLLRRLGHPGRYSLYHYLDRLDSLSLQNTAADYLAAILPIASVVLMFQDVRIGILCLIASLIYCLISYFGRKRKIDPYLTCFRYILRLLECADALTAEKLPLFEKETASLSAVTKAMKAFRRGAGLVISSSQMASANPVEVILDYTRMIFHLDLIRFHSMAAFAQKHCAEIDRICTCIGRIDAMISVSSFAKSLPGYCYPDLRDGQQMNMKGMYHPLLSDPVLNDFQMKRCVLITGSNASGKSTFLKSAAICALLAQTIGVVPAVSYQGQRCRIFTSMALRDNLRGHESYFLAEIRSLKRIYAASGESSVPVLCFIDEVLRGTNTIERIASSAEILHAFAAEGILTFAATHDIELTELLQNDFDNYHFGEELKNGDVVFSYKIMPGKSTGRNAIRLLSELGFPENVTQRAQRRAEHFEKTGIWAMTEDT